MKFGNYKLKDGLTIEFNDEKIILKDNGNDSFLYHRTKNNKVVATTMFLILNKQTCELPLRLWLYFMLAHDIFNLFFKACTIISEANSIPFVLKFNLSNRFFLIALKPL